jgi:hypothetical protein
LGGDEVRELTCWNQSTAVQAFMAQQGFATVWELREWFQGQVQGIVAKYGRRAMMWEEVLLAGFTFTNDSIVTPWISPDVTTLAVSLNLSVINYFSYYLDQQAPPGVNDTGTCNFYYYMRTWNVFYNYDPVYSAGLNDSTAHYVLGGTASLWGENADTSNALAEAWPRAAATAERLWSAATVVNQGDATEARLEHFRCHIMQRGVPAAPTSIASDYGFCWNPAWDAPAPSPAGPAAASASTPGIVAAAVAGSLGGAAIAAVASYFVHRRSRHGGGAGAPYVLIATSASSAAAHGSGSGGGLGGGGLGGVSLGGNVGGGSNSSEAAHPVASHTSGAGSEGLLRGGYGAAGSS